MADLNGQLTSIVLPVHNQEDHVEAVVRNYQEALQRVSGSFEFLLVTNACTDRSEEVCADLDARDETVRHIPLEKGGWGRAVRAGLAAARGDTLCYTNSARTTPEILALMVVYAGIYRHVVLKANRRIRDSWMRRLGSLVYNLECRTLFNLSTWDINGTPKVFPRSFHKLLELERDDDLIDAEFTLVCQREGYPMIEVPILATKRHGGESTTNLRSAAQMYWGAYKLAKEHGRVPQPRE